MAVRKNYPLRIDGDILDAVRRWADDELRSLNGQIEYLLRRALLQSKRLPKGSQAASDAALQDSNDPDLAGG